MSEKPNAAPQGTSEPTGTMNCPICGSDKPHASHAHKHCWEGSGHQGCAGKICCVCGVTAPVIKNGKGYAASQRTSAAWLIERRGLCLGFCDRKFSWVTFTDEQALRFSRRSDAVRFIECQLETLKLDDVLVTEHVWVGRLGSSTKLTHACLYDDCYSTQPRDLQLLADAHLIAAAPALLTAAKAALGVLDEVTTIEDNCAYINGKYHGLVDIVQAKVRQAIKEAENE